MRNSQRADGGRWRRVGAACVALTALTAGVAYADDLLIDTEGHTTVEQRLQGDGDGFEILTSDAAGEPYVVRDGALDPLVPDHIAAQPGRASRRTSLAYVAQLTDFQLSDEESPARVEFLDTGASSAHRPQEALNPFYIDASLRQVNAFAPESPVPQGDQHGNAGNSMDFALLTGDQADNSQRNEMVWLRQLLEGGPGNATDFGSGVEDPGFYSPANVNFTSKRGCPEYLASKEGDQADAAAEAVGYTGVQDYDDYPVDPPPGPAYYDPDEPMGQYAGWPLWDGLLDRAQTLSFTPEGLDVPSYWTNGNHDALVQGNEDAIAPFEDIAIGCFKALGTTSEIGPGAFQPDPSFLLTPASPAMLVPPDPMRRFVDKRQIKAIIGATDEATPGPEDDEDHGFGFVSQAENDASESTASYYAWNPPETPGFRFINVDTVAEGGQTAEGVGAGSSHGNIDDPQFQWLKQELNNAQAADKLIVLFGHHPVRSMDTEVIDEQAAECTVDDTGGPLPQPHDDDEPPHDVNPGCDRDPRDSAPVHLGQDPVAGDPRESFVELLDNYPNVLSYIAGHTHEHKLIPFERSDQSVWWEINTSSTLDWPQQHRLVEFMDNRDGTLSIFGTVLDHASDATSPPGPDASGFNVNQLASIGRTIAFNDPQSDPNGGGDGSGEGTAKDRNVEMLLGDPRRANLRVTKTDSPDPVTVGDTLTYTVTVSNSGPSTATATTLTDHLPPTVEFDDAVPDNGSTCAAPPAPPAAPDVVCALGDIAPGDDVEVVITVTPRTATLPGQPIVNTAEVESVLSDPNPANNTAQAETTVNAPPGPEADLSIGKTASAGTVQVGDQLVYTLAVVNQGPDTATGVAVSDQLPPGVAFNTAVTDEGFCVHSEGEITCPLEDLDEDETASVEITVTTESAGTIQNQASVSSGVSDPNTDDNTAAVSTTVAPQPQPGGGGGGGVAGEGGGGPRTGPCAHAKADVSGINARGTHSRDLIRGTGSSDRLVGLRGRDRIKGFAGHDCLFGNRGPDVIKGGPGIDKISGSAGRDLLVGGPGKDFIKGGLKRDKIRARDGHRDVINCGPGKDVVIADFLDKVHGCEDVRRGAPRRGKRPSRSG